MQLDIKHVCLVVSDLEKAMDTLRSLWEIGPFRFIDSDHPEGIVRGENVHYKGKIAFAKTGDIEIELIEPTEGESIWREFLRNKGDGVHHLGMYVKDLDKELARLKEEGIRVLQSGETEHVRIAYMDTENILGVIIELLQNK